MPPWPPGSAARTSAPPAWHWPFRTAQAECRVKSRSPGWLDFSPLRAGLALVPATATVMATSMFLTRRLLPKRVVKRMLLLGLAAMGLGQAWLSQLTAGGSYE